MLPPSKRRLSTNQSPPQPWPITTSMIQNTSISLQSRVPQSPVPAIPIPRCNAEPVPAGGQRLKRLNRQSKCSTSAGRIDNGNHVSPVCISSRLCVRVCGEPHGCQSVAAMAAPRLTKTRWGILSCCLWSDAPQRLASTGCRRSCGVLWTEFDASFKPPSNPMDGLGGMGGVAALPGTEPLTP